MKKTTFETSKGILKSCYRSEDSESEIVIPSKVTGIAKWAFKYNENFQSITIPASVIKFECEAFEFCKKIKEVKYGGTLDDWCNLSFDTTFTSSPLHNGSDLYINSTLLTDLIVPDDITSLSVNSFARCTSIVSVKIGSSCKTIGKCAFCDCINIKKVEVAEGVIEIGDSAFCDCKSLKEVTIAEGVITIGALAFRGCSSLERIVLPSTVKKIDKYAFSHCNSLKEIVIKGTPEFDKTAFNECDSIESVVVGEELLEKGFPWWKDHFGTDNAIVFGLKSFPSESKVWKYAKKNPQIACEVIIKKRRLDLLTAFLEEVKKLDSVIVPDVVDLAKSCGFAEAIPLILNSTNQNKTESNPLAFADIDVPIISTPEKRTRKKETMVEEKISQEVWDTITATEAYMEDILKNRTLSDEEKVFTSGVCYAGTKKLCPANLLNLIFSEYYILWNKYKYHQQTRGVPFNNATPLYLLVLPDDAIISTIADKLAAPLDKNELSKAFGKNIYGNDYRYFLMSFARFASEEDMSTCIQKIEEKKFGNSKNKYWASNMTAALIYSNTKAAYNYLKAKLSLYSYAKLRNITLDDAKNLFSDD